MSDTLTRMLSSYFVGEKLSASELSPIDVIQGTNIKTLIAEHLKDIDNDAKRCIAQYEALTRFKEKPPFVIAQVVCLEYDKANGAYHRQTTDTFDLAYVLNTIDHISDIEQTALDTLTLMHKACDLALIDWDGCEFELNFFADDVYDYIEWRKVMSTYNLSVTTHDEEQTVRAECTDGDITIRLIRSADLYHGHQLDIDIVNASADKITSPQMKRQLKKYLPIPTSIPCTTDDEVLTTFLTNLHSILYDIICEDTEEVTEQFVEQLKGLSAENLDSIHFPLDDDQGLA